MAALREHRGPSRAVGWRHERRRELGGDTLREERAVEAARGSRRQVAGKEGDVGARGEEAGEVKERIWLGFRRRGEVEDVHNQLSREWRGLRTYFG